VGESTRLTNRIENDSTHGDTGSYAISHSSRIPCNRITVTPHILAYENVLRAESGRTIFTFYLPAELIASRSLMAP